MENKKSSQSDFDLLKLLHVSTKRHNIDLARALSKQQMENKRLINIIHEQQMMVGESQFEITRLRECFKRIIDQFALMSVPMADIMQNCTDALRKTTVSNGNLNDQKFQTSTQNNRLAVKRMIDGHEIGSPTIYIPRVPDEQFAQLISNDGNALHNDEVNEDLLNKNDEEWTEEEEEQHDETEDSDNVSIKNAECSRLITIEEIDERVTSPDGSTSKSSPLLSGIFNDATGYSSPARGVDKVRRRVLSRSFKQASSKSAEEPSQLDLNISESTTQIEEMEYKILKQNTFHLEQREKMNCLSETCEANADETTSNLSIIAQLDPNESSYDNDFERSCCDFTQLRGDELKKVDEVSLCASILSSKGEAYVGLERFSNIPNYDQLSNKMHMISRSTPYSSKLPQQLSGTEYNKENISINSIISPQFVSDRRRKRAGYTRQEAADLSYMKSCSVILKRLSQASEIPDFSKREQSLSTVVSSRPKRERRPSSLKEPSLRKKLRRPS